MITKNLITTIFFAASYLFCFSQNTSQQAPALKIDNDTTYFTSDISFPFWLKAGQSLQSLQNVKNVSILEFTVDSTGNMKFSRIVSGNLNTPSIVPAGKVWKLESIGLSSVYNSNQISINNSGQVSHGFSSSAIPSIFTSPKTFRTPGTYQWIVPPDVTKICIEVWGGGGNGGGVMTDGSSGVFEGGGGGGGDYGYECFSVVPNTVFNVIVGSSGESSSFANLISASGGQNGTGYIPNINHLPGLPGPGGTSTAYFHVSGNIGNGRLGGSGANGGIGGDCTGDYYYCQGSNGVFPGGGGGGSHTANGNLNIPSGGLGAFGQVIIYW